MAMIRQYERWLVDFEQNLTQELENELGIREFKLQDAIDDLEESIRLSLARAILHFTFWHDTRQSLSPHRRLLLLNGSTSSLYCFASLDCKPRA